MPALRRSLLLSMAVLLVAASVAHASVVGYWRMETDSDGGAGFSVPNEVAGGALTGGSGDINTQVPANPIPQSGDANTGSLNGSADINGTIAQYAALDTSSITVEFFARTNEGDARLLQRFDGTSGLRIDNPGSMRVQYSTASEDVTLSGLNNFDGDWDHVALTYDQKTGVGRVYINGSQVGSHTGTAGDALVWPALDLLVGNGMDGGPGISTNSNGYMDELKISNIALSARSFLNAPNTGVLANQALSQPGQTIPDETKNINDHGPMDTWLLTDDGAGGGGDQWRISGETLLLSQSGSSEAQAAIQWVANNQTAQGSAFLHFLLDWNANGSTVPNEIDLRAYVFGWNDGDAVPSVDAQNATVGAGDEFVLNGAANLIDGLSGNSPYVLIDNNVAAIAGLTEGNGFERILIPVDFSSGYDYLGVMFYGEAAGGASLAFDNIQFVAPEPSSLLLAGQLLLVVGLLLFRRRKR